MASTRCAARSIDRRWRLTDVRVRAQTSGAYKRVAIGGSSVGASFSCADQAFVDAFAAALRGRLPFARACPSDGAVWRAAQCAVTRTIESAAYSDFTCVVTTRVTSLVECWGCVRALGAFARPLTRLSLTRPFVVCLVDCVGKNSENDRQERD